MLTILKQKTVEGLLEYLTFNYTWRLTSNGTLELNSRKGEYYEIKGIKFGLELVYQDEKVLDQFSKLIK